MFKNDSLSAWPHFIETFTESSRVLGVTSYLTSIFMLLHNPCIELYKLVKECTVRYSLSDRLMTEGSQGVENDLLKPERGYNKGSIYFLALLIVMGGIA